MAATRGREIQVKTFVPTAVCLFVFASCLVFLFSLRLLFIRPVILVITVIDIVVTPNNIRHLTSSKTMHNHNKLIASWVTQRSSESVFIDQPCVITNDSDFNESPNDIHCLAHTSNTSYLYCIPIHE